MIGIEMSLFHKGTSFNKTQHNYIGGICIGFAHVKHFGCGRNFEPLRNCETKGFEFFFQNKILQEMINQEGKKYFNLIISHFPTT